MSWCSPAWQENMPSFLCFFRYESVTQNNGNFFFTTKMSPIQMNPKLAYIHLPYNLPKLVIYLFQDNPQKRKVESSTILDINISVHELHLRTKQQKTAGVDNPFLQEKATRDLDVWCGFFLRHPNTSHLVMTVSGGIATDASMQLRRRRDEPRKPRRWSISTEK